MNRLTERDEYGNANIIGADMDEWLNGSTEFETLNLITNALNRLAAYEDAEADGRLMVPPCKVGNTAYRIDLDEIIEYTVKGFAGGEKIETVYLEYCYNGRTYGCSFDVESLYFTRAEAEAALKGATK